MPPGYPGGENLWAAFRLIVEEKAWHFRLLLGAIDENGGEGWYNENN